MCTSCILRAKDGSIIHTKTNEYEGFNASELYFIPRGDKINSHFMVNEDKGWTFDVKYAFMGANWPQTVYKRELIMDGMNEYGLSVSGQNFAYTHYPNILKANEVTEDMVSFAGLIPWILGNIKSIADLKEKAEEMRRIFFWPAEMNENMFGQHLGITDPTGESIVIEPEDGILKFKPNPLGVLTNGAGLEWHYEHLKNYASIMPFQKGPLVLQGMDFKTPGTGNSLQGMPGDYTPASRFIRMSILASWTEKPDTYDDLIATGFRIMGTTDIVNGVSRTKYAPKEFKEFKKQHPWAIYLENEGEVGDHTDSVLIKDLKDLKFYYKTIYNASIRFVDMKKYIDRKERFAIPIDDDNSLKFQEVELKKI